MKYDSFVDFLMHHINYLIFIVDKVDADANLFIKYQQLDYAYVGWYLVPNIFRKMQRILNCEPISSHRKQFQNKKLSNVLYLCSNDWRYECKGK